MRRLLIPAAAVTLLAALAGGQQASATIRLTLTEGTSMAAALSPDGRTIVIDLLGALWTLDANGGPAARILDDGYDARMPSWSPDGDRIAFQAYRHGTWNIFTLARDGSALRQETAGAFDDREPHWSPDGTRIAFASDRSGNYDVWLLTLSTGEVRPLTTNPANDARPAWSPDGREIAFVSDRSERGVYAIAVDSGSERLVRADAAAVSSPSWSPDGATVAYPAVDGHVTRLMIRDRNIADAAEDVFPFRAGFAGDHVLYTADGRLKMRPAAGGAARVIPFSADVDLPRPSFVPRRGPLPVEWRRPVLGLMHPAISPDGSRIAVAALGDLWLMPVYGSFGAPTRLTDDEFVETDPAWSPDGARLAFSSDREGTMDLWIRDMTSGVDRKIASRAMSAAWSPDGTRLAFLDAGSRLQIVTVASGEIRQAHDRLNEPGRPSWSPDGRAIVMSALRPYSTRFREGVNQVLRVSLDGGEDRWFTPAPHKSIGMREDSGPVWSPDGTQMAAIVDGHLAAFPVGRDGTPLGPPRRLSTELANSPSWTADSRQLLYQAAHGLRLLDLIDGGVQPIAVRAWSWGMLPHVGTITVHAGRLFDGRADAVRQNVDVVITGNRIMSVEPHHANTHIGTVIDASNRTVLPGLIESHAHVSKAFGSSAGRMFLAFGITTVRNPAANPYEALEDHEAFASGRRPGPRILWTGEPFDGTRVYYPGGTALDGGTQFDEHFTRARDLHFDFIKTYVRLPDLLQKRVIERAHRMRLPVASHEIYPAAAYGADGVEHIRGTSRRGYSPKMSELRRSYRDVIDLLAASKMTLTPTIGIQGGFQVMAVRDGSWLDDARVRRFVPGALDQVRAIVARRPGASEVAAGEALVRPQERMVAEVVRAGGRVIAGTDAPINPYGLTLLLELEHFVRGGLTPAQAIRTATSVPAAAVGMQDELGAIEPGKLADLVIVEGDPLKRISDLRRTRQVIKNGVVYDVDALLKRP
jgi:Tol biopolymer transport system component/imidazolonepropionase-like amidohydrolase